MSAGTGCECAHAHAPGTALFMCLWVAAAGLLPRVQPGGLTDLCWSHPCAAGQLISRLTSDCYSITRCIATNVNVAMRNLLQVIGEAHTSSSSISTADASTHHVPGSWLGPV